MAEKLSRLTMGSTTFLLPSNDAVVIMDMLSTAVSLEYTYTGPFPYKYAREQHVVVMQVARPEFLAKLELDNTDAM